VTRLFRIPLRVPGLGGVPWLVILLIVPEILSFKLSSTKISFIGGLIASFFLDNPPGPFHLIKYILAGLTIDFFHHILKKCSDYYVNVAIGALSYIISFTSLIILFALIGVNMRVLALGIFYVIALHAIFGAFAGYLSHLIINMVKRGKITRT